MEAVIFDADHTLYTPEVERAYRKKFEFLAAETGIERERISEAWDEAVKEAEGPQEGAYREDAGESRCRTD
ncbi:MAG: hypothetical protein SVS85_02915 [Candidatus Nanohaloarchaea archaeon]|nr:hypothetical protein [Candidatus Nanohaloarchaea archaeon]